MSSLQQGIQAAGECDFPGERHQGLRPQPQILCVCAREVGRRPRGGHREDDQHPICGEFVTQWWVQGWMNISVVYLAYLGVR